ncbi:MAG: trypsin-like serine protease [Anaerolineales bacterium]|nr:trypsin-like serine protease [Anaerolineales bacterium]
MKKIVFAWTLTLVLLFSVVGVAGAITDGELDGEDHPHVVLLLMETELGFKYRCSATLLSPTVVLTAGHCTSNYGYIEEEGDYSAMRVFTESDVDNGDNNYPDAGPNSVEAVSWATHPLYETDAFFVHDVGVVILEDPGIFLDEYGVLPEVDQFDALMPSQGQKAGFTAVGYGLQASFPDGADWKTQADRIRMVAYPHLLQLNAPGMTGDYSMLLSNNHNTGGTCYGDSGGPNFLGDTNIVAGVTSFGMNVSCAGTGGVFRMDRQNVLDFVTPFLE